MPITHRSEAKNGRPIVEGTKIGVYQIYTLIEKEGLSVEDVADAYRELSPEAIEEAVSYAAEHPEEMREIARQEEQAFRTALTRGTPVYLDQGDSF